MAAARNAAKKKSSSTSGSTKKSSSAPRSTTKKDAPAARKSAKGATAKETPTGWTQQATLALRAGEGFSYADVDPSATPGWGGKRSAGEARLAANGAELGELQEKLFADGRTGGSSSVLLVLQGMDTSGKGGIVRHVVGLVDPQGVTHRSFGPPTPAELKHSFLWRIRNALPQPGYLGVFDRSHYEDVLAVRVHELVPESVWSRRYEQINRFEAIATASGTRIVKVALVISLEEQKARLAERLERADKHWKYSPNDIDSRLEWPAYQEAYQAVLDRTSTDVAPWHVVPADKKWFARLAVSELLRDALTDLDLGWPAPTYDVAHERARLARA